MEMRSWAALLSLPARQNRAITASFQTTAEARSSSPEAGFCFAGLASDFYLLEFLQSGFDLLKIESTNTANFDHRNDAVARPVSEASAADFEFLGALLGGDQFGNAVRCGEGRGSGLGCHSVLTLAQQRTHEVALSAGACGAT